MNNPECQRDKQTNPVSRFKYPEALKHRPSRGTERTPLQDRCYCCSCQRHPLCKLPHQVPNRCCKCPQQLSLVTKSLRGCRCSCCLLYLLVADRFNRLCKTQRAILIGHETVEEKLGTEAASHIIGLQTLEEKLGTGSASLAIGLETLGEPRTKAASLAIGLETLEETHQAHVDETASTGHRAQKHSIGTGTESHSRGHQAERHTIPHLTVASHGRKENVMVPAFKPTKTRIHIHIVIAIIEIPCLKAKSRVTPQLSREGRTTRKGRGNDRRRHGKRKRGTSMQPA